LGCIWLLLIVLVEVLLYPRIEIGDAILDDSSDEEDQSE